MQNFSISSCWAGTQCKHGTLFNWDILLNYPLLYHQNAINSDTFNKLHF